MNIEKLDVGNLAWFDKSLAFKLNEIIDNQARLEKAIWFVAKNLNLNPLPDWKVSPLEVEVINGLKSILKGKE